MKQTIGCLVAAGVAVIGGIVCAVVGRKMGKGEIGPNALVGIRTQRAYRSDEDWHAAQSSCAPYVLMLAVISLDSAVLCTVKGLFYEYIPGMVIGLVIAVQWLVGIVLMCCAAARKTSGA